MYLLLSIPILPTLITSRELSHLFLAVLLASSLLPVTHPAPSKLLFSPMFIVDPHSLVNGTAGLLPSSQGLLFQSPLLFLLFPTMNFLPKTSHSHPDIIKRCEFLTFAHMDSSVQKVLPIPPLYRESE